MQNNEVICMKWISCACDIILNDKSIKRVSYPHI